MTALRLEDLRQHQDILRLRSGETLAVRFVEPRDAQALQHYFRSLTVRSRYNRFLGAMSELPPTELDHFIHAGVRDRFSVIAVMTIDGVETIVGEARYGFEAGTASFEFGVSIDSGAAVTSTTGAITLTGAGGAGKPSRTDWSSS